MFQIAIQNGACTLFPLISNSLSLNLSLTIRNREDKTVVSINKSSISPSFQPMYLQNWAVSFITGPGDIWREGCWKKEIVCGV